MGCGFVFNVCLDLEQLRWLGGKLFSLVILSISSCFISSSMFASPLSVDFHWFF